jgi:hypothetical protein
MEHQAFPLRPTRRNGIYRMFATVAGQRRMATIAPCGQQQLGTRAFLMTLPAA